MGFEVGACGIGHTKDTPTLTEVRTTTCAHIVSAIRVSTHTTHFTYRAEGRGCRRLLYTEAPLIIYVLQINVRPESTQRSETREFR